MVAHNVAAAKSALRREMRRRRESLPAAQRERESAEIAQAVLAHPLVDAARTVHTFIGALAGEVETRELVQELLDRDKRVVCPVVAAGDPVLLHRRIETLHDLVKSKLGLWEPGSACKEIDVALLDVVLVPGLAFDRRGGRLGMGGGYYDQFLTAKRATKPAGSDSPSIGLCFDVQLVDSVPQGPGDVRMDWVVSRETVNCGTETGG